MLSGGDEQMMSCRLTVPLPNSPNVPIQFISREFPNHRFTLLNVFVTNEHGLTEELEIAGEPVWDSIVARFKGYPGVISVHVLRKSEERIHLRLAARESLPLREALHAIEELGIGIRLPFTIVNGTMAVLLVATNSTLKKLVQRAQKIVPGVSVAAIRPAVVSRAENLLTPRQAEVFRVAISAGYWDVPRRTNLAEIAQRLRVSKSTISETLAHIENKLLHEVADDQLSPH